MRLQQHLSRDLGLQLQARESVDATEMQPAVYGLHTDEIFLAVHDAVVVGEGDGQAPPKVWPVISAMVWKGKSTIL
jgi:hypothetical protein